MTDSVPAQSTSAPAQGADPIPDVLRMRRYLFLPDRRQLGVLLRPLKFETWLHDRRAWVEEGAKVSETRNPEAFFKGIPGHTIISNTGVLPGDPPITSAVEVLRDSIVTYALVRMEQMPGVVLAETRSFASLARQTQAACEAMGPQAKSKFMKIWNARMGKELAELAKFAGYLRPTSLLNDIAEAAAGCAKPSRGRPSGAEVRPGAPAAVKSPHYQLSVNLIYLWNRFRGYPIASTRTAKGEDRLDGALDTWAAKVFEIAFETARAYGDTRDQPTWQTIRAEGLEPALRDFKRIAGGEDGNEAREAMTEARKRGIGNLIREVRRDPN